VADNLKAVFGSKRQEQTKLRNVWSEEFKGAGFEIRNALLVKTLVRFCDAV
jgi:hypothetical protein